MNQHTQTTPTSIAIATAMATLAILGSAQSSFAAAPHSDQPDPIKLEKVACAKDAKKNAACLRAIVPENYDDPAGRKIALDVMILPPAQAKQIVTHLANGKLIIAPNRAHSMYEEWDGCLGKVANRFLETADVKKLDTGCVRRLRFPTFEVSGAAAR